MYSSIVDIRGDSKAFCYFGAISIWVTITKSKSSRSKVFKLRVLIYAFDSKYLVLLCIKTGVMVKLNFKELLDNTEFTKGGDFTVFLDDEITELTSTLMCSLVDYFVFPRWSDFDFCDDKDMKSIYKYLKKESLRKTPILVKPMIKLMNDTAVKLEGHGFYGDVGIVSNMFRKGV